MTETKKPTRKRPTKRNVIITNEQRRQMVAEAAYYLSEQRGFAGGDAMQDWLEAEARIDHTYGKAA